MKMGIRLILLLVALIQVYSYSNDLLSGCTIVTNCRSQLRKIASIAVATSILLPSTAFAAEITTPPQQLFGLKQGRLLKCKQQSNCISTSSITSVEKYSRPWEFTNDPADEFEQIAKVIDEDKFLKLVERNKDTFYIHAEAKSVVPPTGVDDLEFLIIPQDKIITYRSNSREVVKAGSQVLGDGGSNRNRLDSLQRRLKVGEMGMTEEAQEFIKKNENTNFISRIREASKPNEINFIDNSVPENTEVPK